LITSQLVKGIQFIVSLVAGKVFLKPFDLDQAEFSPQD